MKIVALIASLTVALTGITAKSYAQPEAQHVSHAMSHEMQHGFVLAVDDSFASHLVTSGHHSRQAEIIGQLLIEDPQEMQIYQERKSQSAGSSYFLFQAQNLDLPTLSAGQVLTGHIVESKLGDYEPQNKIVRSATFRVQKVLLNIPNPFFSEDLQISSSVESKRTLDSKNEKKNCCDTGAKRCNWKC